MARAKQVHAQSILYPFFRDGGGATARSEGGVGNDVTPPETPSLETNSRVIVTPRTRSRHYYLARDALSRVADCGMERLDLSLVKAHFVNWDKDYRLGRYVRLSKEDEYLFIRAINRFSEDYKRRLRRKLWPLRFVKWDLKLELTLDPKRFVSLYYEFAFIDPAWAKQGLGCIREVAILSFLRCWRFRSRGILICML